MILVTRAGPLPEHVRGYRQPLRKGELEGLQLPLRGGAVWKLTEGDITELEYDTSK
jgi:hypothetical protein